MDLQSVAIQAAQQNGVPPDFFLSLIGNGEGGFANPTGVSPKGAMGVGQLMPETARAMGVADPSDPVQNLNGAAKYAGLQWKKYGGDPVLAAAAYNAGPGAVDSHGGVPPYPETQAYVKRVTGGMESSLPSPDQVLGGYSGHGAGSVPGGQGAAQDTSGGGAELAMPSPDQVLGNYAKPAPTPSGSATGGTQPTYDAQNNVGRNPDGSIAYIGKPASVGADGAIEITSSSNPDAIAAWLKAHPDDPANRQAAPQAQDTSPLGLYQARVQPAMNALAADFKTAQAPPQGVFDTIMNAAPLGLTPRNLKTAADAVSYITAPISAAADYVVGKPVNALSGGRIPIQTAGDVGSFAIPVAGEMREAALLDKAAEAAGMNAQGYRNATAATQATAQALAAARRAATPRTPGPVSNALAPFVARFSEDAAKAQAGQKVAANATDLPAVKSSLANGADEIVPGSTPTTFQQTGDLGLGSLERAVATKNPDQFGGRRADQNTARVGVLQALQSGADPAQLSTALRGGLEDMDRATDLAVQKAASGARTQTNALGGEGTPEGYGANVRDLVQTAENGARARESTLWQAIDPNGDLTGNVGQTVQTAQKIIAEVPKTAKPMDGEEGAIFQTAAAMPHLAPVSDLVALRSRISTALRNELITQGRSPTYARLSQLRGAIQDNLAGSIADKIAEDDAAVQSGTMHPDDALGAWMRRAVNAYIGASDTGPASGARASEAAGAGAAPVRGGAGATGAVGGQPGGAAGGSGLFAPEAIGAARADIDAWRGSARPSIFDAVRQLGGMKLRKADGSLVAGPDVQAALTDVRRPGVVNNRSGSSPEAMAQALADRGWFGPNPGDPSAQFEAALSAEARGDRQFHPLTPAPANPRLAGIEQEVGQAGISASDRPALAAEKLAGYRQAMQGLYGKAEQMGVSTDRPFEDVLSDVTEREAIQGRVETPEQEFDRLAHSRPTQPTVDEGYRNRLAAATEATKTRARTFGLQPVSSVTAKAGASDLYRLPDGQVPGKFFHPGPAGYQHMQALLKSAGPEALPVIEDYAAQSLKRAALKDDGTLDPGKYAAWVARHQDALRALPAETQAHFADAAKAAESVQEAMASRAAALKDYQSGAIGRVLNVSEPEDVTRTVGSILNGRTSVQDMKALARVTQGNADARAGLRQAIADHIAQKLIGNTEVGTSGQGGIKADAFQNFSRQSRAALSQVFTREEVDRIEAVARDIQRAKRSENAIRLPGNSNTAQDQSLLAKHGDKIPRSLLDLLGAGLGVHFMHGEMGMIVGGATSEAIQAIRSAGIQRVDDLVTRAMLDPNVARELLAKVPTRGGGQVAPAVMNNRMRGLYAALAGIGATAPVQSAPQGNALAH